MLHKKKNNKNNKGVIVVLEFIKPNYHKIQKKKTWSGSEADQALSLTTNLRRDSRVVSLHNWRYFLAFFRWAEASAKRARSARHAPSPVVRVRCSKPVQQPASRTLAFACLRFPEKRAKITSVLQGREWWTEQFQSFFFTYKFGYTLKQNIVRTTV